MATTQTRDTNNDRVMRQFLLLPLVLGALMIANGAIGIYAAKRSSTQLNTLNDAALGPTLAFDEIMANLNVLSKTLLRLNQSGIDKEGQTKLLKKSELILKKISKQVKTQVESSQGKAYSDYLKGWVGEWDGFQKGLDEKLKAPESLKGEFGKLDEAVSRLIEKMNNVSTFIQTDVQDMVDQSSKFSKKTTWVLAITLALGVLIGFLSSAVIVKSIRKLFLIIAEGKKNIETLLNNLDQGFLVFDEAGKVQEGVSQAAKVFLGSDPTGRAFHEVLPVKEKAKEDVLGWQKLIYEGNLRFVDFKPLAPQSFELENRYIELDFRPIYIGGSEKLDKVICIASDKTVERKLREKAEAEAALVKLVMSVLSDRGSFVDFVLETRKTFKELTQELKNQKPNIDLLFRGMHSLKGGAAAFNMIRVSREAHGFENSLAEIRVEGGARLMEFIPKLQDGVVRIEKMFEGFLVEHQAVFGTISENEDRTKTVPVTTIYSLCHVISDEIGKQSPIFREFVSRFAQDDLGVTFKRYESVVKGVAERQMKKVDLIIEQGKARVYIEPYLPLVGSFIHAFRNAVDHGIEDEVTRVEIGKSDTGKIEMGFEILKDGVEPDRVRIRLRDDGQGIDSAIVRRKAVEKKIVTEEAASKMTDQQVYQLLFHNGFSTRDEVSDLSGRGVGLDAVRYEATKMGGKTWLESTKGKGTCLVVEVPLYDSPVVAAGVESIERIRPAA